MLSKANGSVSAWWGTRAFTSYLAWLLDGVRWRALAGIVFQEVILGRSPSSHKKSSISATVVGPGTQDDASRLQSEVPGMSLQSST